MNLNYSGCEDYYGFSFQPCLDSTCILTTNTGVDLVAHDVSNDIANSMTVYSCLDSFLLGAQTDPNIPQSSPLDPSPLSDTRKMQQVFYDDAACSSFLYGGELLPIGAKEDGTYIEKLSATRIKVITSDTIVQRYTVGTCYKGTGNYFKYSYFDASSNQYLVKQASFLTTNACQTDDQKNHNTDRYYLPCQKVSNTEWYMMSCNANDNIVSINYGFADSTCSPGKRTPNTTYTDTSYSLNTCTFVPQLSINQISYFSCLTPHTCFGLSNLDDNVCSRKGQCINDNVCKCTTKGSFLIEFFFLFFFQFFRDLFFHIRVLWKRLFSTHVLFLFGK